MSSSAAYGSWSHGASRSSHRTHPSVERRTSDSDNQTAFSHGSQFMHDSYGMGSSDMRQMSVSTLSGAMGEASIGHSRHSKSPASSHSGSVYGSNMQQNPELAWNTAQSANMTIAMNSANYPGVAGHGGLFEPSLAMSMNEYGTTRNVSPESLSPHSPYGHTQMTPQHATNGMLAFPGSMGQYTPSPESNRRDSADLVQQLQRRVAELERECHRAKSALAVAQSSSSGLPNAPPSAQFQAQWRQRTEARKRIFCSLNRAGNALCSWHDSRRERRAYPPRNAPPGYLNCGCTYDEALFEESLSRHGVGSYHPGENVRMDPALRNPLLKLLQQRYNYKDGDFEHDPVTETWKEGESPAAWDQKAQSGALIRRRNENAH
ncbi:hypothetical protein BDN70DRAFT_908002 [Pholiota conissans]|uniref:Uncharacterized protein n=1 Tax=Pholiota conissans TaxID=109636 RepID=A0A9P5YW16_9AGAR|nr:hypothetical protein BDN70DRAFT_908002 [Pholiota conissans]